MRHTITRIPFGALTLAITGAVSVLAMLVHQRRRTPAGTPDYVALGSSFAAGLGLGDRAPGSPRICRRSINGYPQRLARATGLSLVDMTCSGSTANQTLNGGQYFQRSQIAAIKPTTRLVTLTAGGNDISYIGDLVGMGYGNRHGLMGRIMRLLMKAPHADTERNVSKLTADIQAVIVAARQRAPSAHVVVVTYPAVLPEHGTCPALGLTERQVVLMRPVAAQLAEATRAAAQAGGATLVDMATISIGHDACSSAPWVNGLSPEGGAPYHPTQAGAEATAREVARAVGLDFRRCA